MSPVIHMCRTPIEDVELLEPPERLEHAALGGIKRMEIRYVLE